MEVLLRGRPIRVDGAERLGLVADVAKRPERLLERALVIGRALADAAPLLSQPSRSWCIQRKIAPFATWSTMRRVSRTVSVARTIITRVYGRS